MLTVPVYNPEGTQIGQESIDEAVLGGQVNAALLKQAVVMFEANQRQGTVKTKSRAEVEGSSRKLYRQKGTGRARSGNLRTPVKKGGGHAFAKRPRDFRQRMPVQMRRLARDQAVLAKIQAADAAIVDGLQIAAPKTKPFYQMLTALSADRGCVFATDGVDDKVYRSARNIPRTDVTDVGSLNAYQILLRRKLIFTRPAFERYKGLAQSGRGGGE